MMGQEASPIPVIDISKPSEQTGHELVDAAARYGFIFIKSKSVGISADALDQMFALVCKLPCSKHALLMVIMYS